MLLAGNDWYRRLCFLDWRLAYHDYYRADGRVLCRVCGRELRRHPQLYDYQKEPPEFTGLWLLCDGDMVHL